MSMRPNPGTTPDFASLWRQLLQAIDARIAAALSRIGVTGSSLPVQTLTTTTPTTLTGILEGDAGTLNVATPGTDYIAPNAPIVGATKTKITYDTLGLVTAGADAALDDLGDVVAPAPSVDDVLRWNGAEWVNGLPVNTSAGDGVVLFLDDTASGISTYNILSNVPDTSPEEIDAITLTSGSGEVEIDSYITDPLGRTLIDAGAWEFDTYCKVNNTGSTSEIVIRVYSRTSGGVETPLFNTTTGTINATVVELINTVTIQTSFVIVSTDRLLVRYYAKTNSGAAKTISMYHSGTAHYSHMHTPFITKHNDLAGLQGGAANEYYHLTSAQATVVANTSGVNTGDVTDATITITDVTTQNASTTKHGWLLKAVAPASGLLSVVGIGNGETIYKMVALFDTTNPAALGVAGPGTQLLAARRDHIHTMPALDGVAAPTDVTTLNASTSAHGLLLKATAPAANVLNVVGIANGETLYTNKTLFDATNPAALGAVGPGTSLIAAHRDHVHANPALDTLAAPTDITTLNASTSAHGLALKATAPGAGLINVLGLANGETVYKMVALFDTTNPAATGIAAPGTAVIAARRDHVHQAPVTPLDLSAVAGTFVTGYNSTTGAWTTQAQFDRNEYDCSGTLDLTNAAQDVAGCTVTFTPTVNEYAHILAVCQVNQAAGTAICNAADVLVCNLVVNGVNTGGANNGTASGGAGTQTLVRYFAKVALTANTAYTIKLQALNSTGNRGRVTTRTQMIVERLAS